MPTDPNMTGLIYPTEGGDDDVWDTIMNTTVFPIIGAHDHTTGKGVPVPSAGLRINADVAWSYSGTSYSITALKALDFAAQAAADVSSYAGALFVNSSDSNNLYFRTISGSNVKITDGTTLNVSIVGGIGGDYSSISALFDYDDATDTYRARQETSASVRQYAKLSIADLIIREYDAAGDASVPAETVTIKSPDSLAASYALTLFAALPGTAAAVQCSTAGVLSASNTFTEALTAADFKHTTAQTTTIGIANAYDVAGAHTNLGDGRWALGNSTGAIQQAAQIKVGERITLFRCNVNKLSDATNTLTATLFRVTASAVTSIGTATNNSNAPGDVTLVGGPFTEDVAFTYSYMLQIAQSDATPSAVDTIANFEIGHTRP